MLLSLLALSGAVAAAPAVYNPRPFVYSQAAKRQTTYGSNSSSTLEVDLGYSVYQGYSNTSVGLDIYKGIRFAAPPTGSLRFQAPRAPALNRSSLIDASHYAPICPQSPSSGSEGVKFSNQTGADEDCLFLNVFTPSDATGPLPVYVWIHGGGYGQGNGRQDLTAFINTNDNAFVGVAIQYRLGAFGFLSSDEVFRKGAVNAAILDQFHALQWVQEYIHLFNGDASRVTISGESAGGGSVMLQDMAYGGSLGTSLFVNSIVQSPYLPMQYNYNDWAPSQAYYAFASAAGCTGSGIKPVGNNGSSGFTQPIFECLVASDSATLINASATVSQETSYGTWAFLPVTDGVFVQDLPSRQLGRRKVNGLNILSGNNANEGVGFTPQDIITQDDFVAYLKRTFPLFSQTDIDKILFYYPSDGEPTDINDKQFATAGDSGPTALNQSSVGTGQQQRADNVYAETTFVCPSYWLAEAYSGNPQGGDAWKYQFSIAPAYHGGDVPGYYNDPGVYFSVDFITAFQRIFGNFVVSNNPSISNQIATGVTQTNVTANGASVWPAYSIADPTQLDLNTTCPELTRGTYCNSTIATNTFRLVNAYTWEGGRGTRCDFWKSVGEIVPE